MDNDLNLKRLELVLKFLAAAGAIVAFLVSFYQWNQGRLTGLRQEKEAADELKFQHSKEFKRALFDRQANLYFEAANLAGSISSTSDPMQKKKAVERFEDIYFGEMVMVESPGVETAMVRFHECLKANGRDCNLHDAALAIGCTTRRSLRKSWDVDFGRLETNDEYCKQIAE